ncbi:hypothetical protein EV178_004256 [Coemansia sp. RSA 1646]|nr:hypothetical protein EV178_004256 [Coemansia sp. RSA 1646]
MIISHLYTDQLFEPHTVAEWKLNMAAVSSKRSLLLVAKARNVLVYKIDHYTRLPIYRTQVEYPWPFQMDEINAISLGKLLGEEVLIAVYDSGRSAAWNLADGSFTIVWKRSTGVSSWGCAIHDSQNIAAISSNSHNVDVLYPATPESGAGSPKESGEISSGTDIHADQEFDRIEYHEEADEGNDQPDDRERLGAALLYDEATITDSSIADSEELDTNRHNEVSAELAIDHTTDMQNGHLGTGVNTSARSENSDSGQSATGVGTGLDNCDDTAASGPRSYVGTEGRFVPESTHPNQSSPLLLCGTKSDLLLLDPSNNESPVVDKIEYVVSRTPMPSLMEMLTFDRITFLEWVPELAIVVVGSLTGTVTIVRLECTHHDDEPPRYRMRVLAYIPVKSHSSPLYGASVYRNPVDCSQFCSVTLYLIYVDGDLAAHEMRLPLDLAGTALHF